MIYFIKTQHKIDRYHSAMVRLVSGGEEPEQSFIFIKGEMTIELILKLVFIKEKLFRTTKSRLERANENPL